MSEIPALTPCPGEAFQRASQQAQALRMELRKAVIGQDPGDR